jgi:hypothetical protein
LRNGLLPLQLALAVGNHERVALAVRVQGGGALMEAWTAGIFFLETRDGILGTIFLVEVSGHKLVSSQTPVFVWFSTLIFPFYNMLFMNRLQFFWFRGFFVRFLKPKKNKVFFKIRQKKEL